MTAARPELKDKFEGTGNPYFNTFYDSRKVVAIAITTYNSHQQGPIKIADWQRATGLDVAGVPYSPRVEPH